MCNVSVLCGGGRGQPGVGSLRGRPLGDKLDSGGFHSAAATGPVCPDRFTLVTVLSPCTRPSSLNVLAAASVGELSELAELKELVGLLNTWLDQEGWPFPSRQEVKTELAHSRTYFDRDWLHAPVTRGTDKDWEWDTKRWGWGVGYWQGHRYQEVGGGGSDKDWDTGGGGGTGKDSDTKTGWGVGYWQGLRYARGGGGGGVTGKEWDTKRWGGGGTGKDWDAGGGGGGDWQGLRYQEVGGGGYRKGLS